MYKEMYSELETATQHFAGLQLFFPSSEMTNLSQMPFVWCRRVGGGGGLLAYFPTCVSEFKNDKVPYPTPRPGE